MHERGRQTDRPRNSDMGTDSESLSAMSPKNRPARSVKVLRWCRCVQKTLSTAIKADNRYGSELAVSLSHTRQCSQWEVRRLLRNKPTSVNSRHSSRPASCTALRSTMKWAVYNLTC